MVTEKTSKTSLHFFCEKCDFNCIKKGDYTRHLSTNKHKNMENVTLTNKKTSNHNCDNCHKSYISRNGLWVHKKKCIESVKNVGSSVNENIIVNQNMSSDDPNMKNLILDVIKNNTDALKEIMDVCKNMNNTNNANNNMNNSNNTMVNSNNKTFNLQVFLNEQCKDAMNLSDFMESIQLSLEDLENMEKLGYVECMFKNIFGDMEFISIFDRPFHCSDFKRGIIYIKENGVWEKEDVGHSRLINAIRIVEKKNFKLLKEWTEKHPSFSDYNSPDNDKYVKLFGETMNGDKHNLAKLIRKLSKECVIDKSNI